LFEDFGVGGVGKEGEKCDQRRVGNLETLRQIITIRHRKSQTERKNYNSKIREAESLDRRGKVETSKELTVGPQYVGSWVIGGGRGDRSSA